MLGLGLFFSRMSVPVGEVDPPVLFDNGEIGGVYTIRNDYGDHTYQDAAKTTLANSLDDPIRVIEPTSGSGDTTAPADAARPLLKDPSRDPATAFDLVDDDLQVPVTTAGYLFIATTQGMYWGEYDFSANTSIGTPNRNPIYDVVGWCAIDRVLTTAEISDLQSYFVARGAVKALSGDISQLMREMTWTTIGDIDVSSGINFQGVWNGNALTSFPQLDVSSGTNFRGTWGNNNLISLPQLDVSNGTNFYAAWYNNALTSFPYTILQTAPATDYTSAWYNNNLDATSVDGILVTIRDNANAQALDNGKLEVSGGTNAAPTDGTTTGLDGITAKSDLQARGWTVNTN